MPIENLEFEQLLQDYGNVQNTVEPPLPEDVPLTEEEKDRFKILLAEIHPQDDAPEPEWDEYLWNQAKLGLTDTLAFGGATLETFVTEPVEYYFQKPSTLYSYEAWQDLPGQASSLGSQFMNNLNKWQTGISIGDPTMRTTDAGKKIVGAGTRIASDVPGYALTGAKTAWDVLKTVPQMFGVGVSGEIGGEIGENLGDDKGRIMGTIVGSVFGPSVFKTTVGTVTKPIKQVYEKYKAYKADPNLVNQQYAAGSAKRLLEIAAKEEGLDNLDTIVKEFAAIKHLLGDEAQGIPLFIQMADNPIIQSQVIRLAKTDAAFRDRVNKEIGNIAQQIDNKANIIFGNKYSMVAGVENFPKQIQTRQRSLNNARQVVDNRIQELSEGLVPNLSKVEVSNKITNLIKKREKLAKEEMSPHYDALKKEARDNKIFMSADDTSTIYQFVKNNKLSDIFGKGTEIEKQIMSILKPRVTPEGFTVKPKLSFEQVDSLKRRINEIKRKPLNATERRKIEQLDEVINNARSKMPGDFNDRLMALDKTYYEKVGVPFGSDTIKNMGSKKYIEEVVPVILKNESSIKQFLNAAGNEGTVVARLAYGSKVYDKVVKNGVINLPALKALIKQDNAIINQIPGMRDELNSIIVDNGRLFKLKGDLDKKVKLAENEVANNFLNKFGYNQDYRGIGQKLAGGDVGFWKKMQKDMKYLDKKSKDAINNNIRRQLLDHILHNTDKSAYQFLTAVENKAIVNEVFGPKYLDDLTKLGKLSDAVKKANVGAYSSNLQKSQLSQLSKLFPGLDINYLYSQGRDRISSNAMKAVRILSRINQAKLGEATDQKIMDVLLDPKAMNDLANIGKTFNFKIDNPLKFREIIGRLSETIPFYSYTGTKVSTSTVATEPESREQVIKY